MKKPIHVIAEMACSHDGEAALARRIIDGAGGAGADSIQFQIWLLEEMMVRHHPAFADVKKLELSRKTWRELAAYARERWPGLAIIACAYEERSVDFAESIGVDAYKLHSADLSNPRLVRHMAATGRRIDLSVGGSTIDEIQTALDWIRAAGGSDVWLMYGYQNFPTRLEDVHLDYMMKLGRLFELPLGYQDHTDAGAPGAFWLPAAAAGMGVEILEKHITHDRGRKGADHEAALEPAEFARFVQMVRQIEAARGLAVPKPFSEDELHYRVYSKKSIVAARPLAAGRALAEDDLTFLRAPELGLPPDRMADLIGRELRHDVPAQGFVGPEDLA
ncbi:MAG: N-acetylneuraminate synthase family protein [Alphaproteobacteria bacterium]|jgi:sialic acid synthase SpsE|nr:N-acetylneuraminate synthase family protein [Alphaproteobacteria bacterium]